MKRKKNKKKKRAAETGGPAVGEGSATVPGAAPARGPEQEAPVHPMARGGRARTREEMMCINCGCAGHFRSECLAPGRCPSTLAYLGYEVPEGGLLLRGRDPGGSARQASPGDDHPRPGPVPPLSVVVTAEVIRAELSAYIGNYRDSALSWEVTETAPMVFLVPFPSAEMLNVCTRDNVKCPIHKFLISIQKAEVEPDAVPPLARVWMFIYGLPKGGKHNHILKAVSEPVGKLLTVDLDSLEGDGPARIEVLCQSPANVDGLPLTFYFGRTKGVRLTYELDLEDLEGRAGVQPPPPATASLCWSTGWGRRSI